MHRFRYFVMRRRELDLELAENFRKLFSRPKIILDFYPRLPVPSSVIYKLCAILNYGMRTRVLPFRSRRAIAFKYLDSTFPVLNRNDEETMINGRCRDISKRRVDCIMASVFGYSAAIDPTRYEGNAVEKSNENARHDGRVIRCPLPLDRIHPDCVYQRLIDNRYGEEVQDLRVPIHGAEIPLVYVKYRPVATRFSNANRRVILEEPEVLFSQEELQRIREFAFHIGIDYGEFDILRDRKDGKIYVIDANMTPWGPPNGLSPEDRRKALRFLCETFEAMLAARKDLFLSERES